MITCVGPRLTRLVTERAVDKAHRENVILRYSEGSTFSAHRQDPSEYLRMTITHHWEDFSTRRRALSKAALSSRDAQRCALRSLTNQFQGDAKRSRRG